MKIEPSALALKPPVVSFVNQIKSGQLFTQPRTGMCPKKYKELKVAHRIASDLLLIGPSKDPIFMTDPTIGRGLSSKYSARLGSAR